MSELFNASNREGDYCQTLLKLFDLHCGMGNYAKAAECLDRAADVDAYEPGHQKRLEMLRGKIDENRFKVIASRFTSMAKTASEPAKTEGPTLGAAALQDLMLQAEILVQYGMRSKAIERLQRIQELFPREEERNQDLQQLYLAAGNDSAPRGFSCRIPRPPEVRGENSCGIRAVAPAPPRSGGIRRRQQLYQGGGNYPQALPPDQCRCGHVHRGQRNWGAMEISRCIVAMRKPGMAPSAVKEYHGEGIKPGEAKLLKQAGHAVQDVAISLGTLTISRCGRRARAGGDSRSR